MAAVADRPATGVAVAASCLPEHRATWLAVPHRGGSAVVAAAKGRVTLEMIPARLTAAQAAAGQAPHPAGGP